jgi:hypothetical protein
MEQNPPSLMARQIGRVNRRLFVQMFLNRLIRSWTAGLVLAVVWFLLEPLVLETPPTWLRWTVAGCSLAVATLVAGILSALAAPSRVFAALAIDEQFALKERVTTSLLLTPQQQGSPAGQALLQDVHQRISQLDIPGRFPVRLSWAAALVPACALALILLALFYELPPSVAKANAREDELKQAPTNKAEINEKFNRLKKKPERLNEPPASEKLKEFEMELDKIANRPRETKDQLRQRLADIQKTEDAIKERQRQVMDKSRSLKNQLQQLDQQAQKTKDGPANDLEKALAEGNLAKAQEAADKLMEKLKNNELSDKEKQQLKDQLDQLQQNLDRLARNQEKQDDLQRLFREGKISKEALEQEMNRLKQDSDKLKDLSQLAQKLGDCKDCLQRGDSEGAMDKLKDAAAKLKEMNLSEQELQDLQDQLNRLREAKQAAGKGDKSGKGDRAGDGDGPGDGDKEGQGKGNQSARGGKGDGKGDTDQPNDGGIGEGKRPLGAEQGFKSFEARQPTDFNPKGKKIFDGFAPGQNFKSRPGPEIAGEVKQAAQEAPEAIEQQKIPKAARDIAKGYFRNLSGQDDKPGPKGGDK